MTERNWGQTDLTGNPRFLLGERKSSKRIDVHRVDVHEDIFDDLRGIAQNAIGELQRRDAKPYASFAAKTSDDYFDVDTSDIPQRRDHRKKEEDPEAYEIASALAMVRECDLHPVMSAEELHEASPSLYAVVFESEGEYVGFVRNTSPRRRVKPGLKYFKYGDTLKKADPPDLAIDDGVDIVVAADRCAVLSPDAFTTLFGDVGIAFEQVPANITGLRDALEDTLPLSTKTLAALAKRCGRRVSDAKRLHHIVTERRTALGNLEDDELQSLLKKRGLDDGLVHGELTLGGDQVSDFLDLIEGRLFNDDVTGEERRADAYSPRKP